jgi:hypothetical protein
MLAALRRARYGYLLALHILLLCAAGCPPTEIAAVLFCSRSSVYRTVRAAPVLASGRRRGGGVAEATGRAGVSTVIAGAPLWRC